jgi:hypothetical protein
MLGVQGVAFPQFAALVAIAQAGADVNELAAWDFGNAFAEAEADIHVEADQFKPFGAGETHPAGGAVDEAGGFELLDDRRHLLPGKEIHPLVSNAVELHFGSGVGPQQGQRLDLGTAGDFLQKIAPQGAGGARDNEPMALPFVREWGHKSIAGFSSVTGCAK